LTQPEYWFGPLCSPVFFPFGYVSRLIVDESVAVRYAGGVHPAGNFGNRAVPGKSNEQPPINH
jgi:hypothetical protein